VQENLSNEHTAVNYRHIRAFTEETWINVLQFNGYKRVLGISVKPSTESKVLIWTLVLLIKNMHTFK